MTPGAIAARKRRNTEWEAKRFNVTMKEYIEIKYDNIYNEYCSFYNSLASKHPNKRNLLKTSTFRSWRKSIIEQTFQKDGVLAVVSDFVEPEDSDSENSDSEITNVNNEDQIPGDQTESTSAEGLEDILSVVVNETVPDILSVTVNETVPDQHYINDINEIMGADNIIDEIINELERDEAIHEMLAGNEVQQPNDDEGIALDYETELEAILEPFDYELEIDW